MTRLWSRLTPAQRDAAEYVAAIAGLLLFVAVLGLCGAAEGAGR